MVDKAMLVTSVMLCCTPSYESLIGLGPHVFSKLPLLYTIINRMPHGMLPHLRPLSQVKSRRFFRAHSIDP